MYELWIDLVSPPQVNFFKPFIEELEKDYETLVSIRDRNQAVELGRKLGLDFIPYGSDDPLMHKKLYKISRRILSLSKDLPEFKVGLATENPLLTAVAVLRGRPSLMFFDNDRTITRYNYIIRKTFNAINKQNNQIIVPEVSKDNFLKIFDSDKLVTYPGYKEHLTIYGFEPDREKIKEIPFSDFILLRSEALSAAYVEENKSIVGELIDRFTKEDINIVYLPRKSGRDCIDKDKISEMDNIFIPDKPVDGLNACYFANAVLTGSGTMGREAAVLGTLPVSFYPHDDLLSVDEDLVKKEKMLHSRDPEEIVDYVISKWNDEREAEFERSKMVKKEVMGIINEFIKHNLSDE